MADRAATDRGAPASPLGTPRAITPDELADELASGRWRKARKQLGKSSNFRCCLGVACEMAGIDFDPTHAVPPDSIDPWAPWLFGVQVYLATLNDDRAGWDEVVRYLRRMNIGDAEASSAEARPWPSSTS